MQIVSFSSCKFVLHFICFTGLHTVDTQPVRWDVAKAENSELKKQIMKVCFENEPVAIVHLT